MSCEGFSSVPPFDDPLAAAVALVEKYGDYQPLEQYADVVACWAPALFQKSGSNLVFYLSRAQASELGGLNVEPVTGGPVDVKGVKVGGRRLSYPDGPARSFSEKGGFYGYEGLNSADRIENTTAFIFNLSISPESSGIIRYVRR